MELNLDFHEDRKVIQESLPAGGYFIGDLFYGLKQKYVDIVYENIEENTLILEEDGKEYTLVFEKVFGGKERYKDCFGHEYEVESEYLGIIPIELCDFGEGDLLKGSQTKEQMIDEINQIGQYLEFDELVDVYIVDGVFLFHWAPESEGGFLKIDTKNAEVPLIDDHEYNDISYEEYLFSQVNQTKEDEKSMLHTIQENVEDYDDVERVFQDEEAKTIDPALLELRYLDSYRS